VAKRGFASETTVHESYDGKTRIKQFLRVSATANNNAANSKRRVSLRPSLIADFCRGLKEEYAYTHVPHM
jgi:hypothetical protein